MAIYFFVSPHVHVQQFQQKHLKQVAVRLKAFALTLKAQVQASAKFTTIQSATGTPIITLDTDLNYGEIMYNINFATGLTVDIVGGTPADLLLVFS